MNYMGTARRYVKFLNICVVDNTPKNRRRDANVNTMNLPCKFSDIGVFLF